MSRNKINEKRPLHQEELEGGAGASSKLEQGLNNIIVAMSEVSRKKDPCFSRGGRKARVSTPILEEGEKC